MNHLFVSYSRKDEALVSAVVQNLRAQGFDVWQDISGKTSGIPYSTKWFAAIEEALYTSAGAVMFCSEAWRESAPCGKEQKLIVELGRRLYERGFVASNDGNISCKVSENEIWCTPTGVSKGYMTEDMMVKMDRVT